MKFVATKKGTGRTTNFFSPLSFVAIFGSGIRDPGSGMSKNQDPGSGINIPDPQHWIYWFKLEPWMALGAPNGGLEGSEWSPRGSVDQWSKIRITLMRNSIRIGTKMENWIRIRMKVMRIRNPVSPFGKVYRYQDCLLPTILFNFLTFEHEFKKYDFCTDKFSCLISKLSVKK